jgi:hypothetical protein
MTCKGDDVFNQDLGGNSFCNVEGYFAIVKLQETGSQGRVDQSSV